MWTMEQYLFYNGQYLPAGSALITADCSGFRYGDGLFETIRLADGKIPLLAYHMERFFGGLRALQFSAPNYFTREYLQNRMMELCRRNRQDNARIRLMIFSGNIGLYEHSDRLPNCIIQSWPLTDAAFDYNENGLVAGIYQGVRKSMDMLSNLKCNNYLPGVLGARYAWNCHWNDALMLNANGNICDATIANVFVVKDGVITTPSLEEGCVAGTMRRYLLERLPAAGYQVVEGSLPPEAIPGADELFLTNAIRGIRWVSRVGNSHYGNTVSAAIHDSLLKKK